MARLESASELGRYRLGGDVCVCGRDGDHPDELDRRVSLLGWSVGSGKTHAPVAWSGRYLSIAVPRRPTSLAHYPLFLCSSRLATLLQLAKRGEECSPPMHSPSAVVPPVFQH